MRFRDRADAGRQLAERLAYLRGRDVVVLGLPRGGVAVAFEVARALGVPLDVVVARKLGAPQQPELAIGAIAPGASVLRRDVIEMLRIGDAEIAAITAREGRRAAELESLLRHGRPAVDVRGRIVVIVDDGLATGATATAAARSVRARGPERVVLAVPVAPPETVAELGAEVDEVIALQQPYAFHAVGLWYDDFAQVTDEAVAGLLDDAA